MAHEVETLQLTFVSTNDLSADANQFKLVKMDTANDDSIVLATANSDDVFGVLQNKPGAGQGASVMLLGVSKVLLGGTVVRGDALMAKSDGTAISRTGQNPSFGMAHESGVSGALISVQLMKGSMGVLLRNNIVSFQLDLAAIANGAGPTNIYTFTPGFAGKIVSCSFTVNSPVTTGAKLATLTPGVAGVATTGGVVALTSANSTPIGAEIKGTAITAGNVFTAAQTINVIATAVTAFVEGSGTFSMVLSG